MTRSLRLTLVGAGGPVGKEFRRVADEVALPIERFRAWDAEPHVGELFELSGEPHSIGPIDPPSLGPDEIVILALDQESSRAVAPGALSAGCRLIDCTGAFLDRDSVPLVVPAINADVLTPDTRLVSMPTPFAGVAALLTSPLLAEHPLHRLHLTGLQGYAHHSRGGMDALFQQTIDLLQTGSVGQSELNGQAAFCCFPSHPSHGPRGPWGGEGGVRSEIQRILDREDLRVSARLIWVPIFHGLAGTLVMEGREPFRPGWFEQRLAEVPWLHVCSPDRPGESSTMAAMDDDRVRVAHPLIEEEDPCILSLWFAADGLRSGLVRGTLEVARILEGLREERRS